MAYRVEIHPKALRELEDLPRKVRARADVAILALASDPRAPGTVKLQGSSDLFRVRVGDYRIIYRVEDDRLVVLVWSGSHTGAKPTAERTPPLMRSLWSLEIRSPGYEGLRSVSARPRLARQVLCFLGEPGRT